MTDRSRIEAAAGGDPAHSTWHTVVADLLQRTALVQPDELASELNVACRPIGVEVTLYLVDHEQRHLWPVPERAKPVSPGIPVENTPAGRAFTTVTTQAERPGAHLWVPMVDGAERLGVVEVTSRTVRSDAEGFRRHAEMLVRLIAHLMTGKLPFGDLLPRVRRTRPMDPSGELLLSMLPPLTFSCHRMVLSAVLEPCYEVGGDAYDYAVDGPIARFMIYDAMGRGLQAALTSATVLAAVRAARRDDRDLVAMAEAADVALAEQFAQLRFATGILGELDIDSGVLRYVNAGHPAPILMRRGRAERRLTGGRRLPLGLADADVVVGEEFLEPGDRILLHSDGVTEPAERAGDESGGRRLAEAAERCTAAGLAAPETLRLLSHSVIEHRQDPRGDDATLMLIEWSHDAAERTQP